MKNFLMRFFGILGIIVALLLISYPLLSDYLMSINSFGEIVANEQAVADTSEDELSEELKAANEYNRNLSFNATLDDSLGSDTSKESDALYNSLLNLSGNGVMGSIKIPTINVDLPIFHGVDGDVLEKGIGHMNGTSLPIGGKGNHSVLAGHTGYSSAKLFSDLNLLEKGDVFFIYTLNMKLAYKVDDIMIVPQGETQKLKVVKDKDYVTLVTCTPFGVNDHRLLIRGERTDFDEAKKIAEVQGNKSSKSTWFNEYLKALIFGAIVFVLIILIFIVINKSRERKAKKSDNKIKEELKE